MFQVKVVPIQFADDDPQLFMVARRTIEIGEEILFDYNDNESRAQFLNNCPVCQKMDTVATNVRVEGVAVDDSEHPLPACSLPDAVSCTTSTSMDDVNSIARLQSASEGQRTLLYSAFCEFSAEPNRTTRSDVECWISGIHENNVDYIMHCRREAITKQICKGIATGAKRRCKRNLNPVNK